MKLRIQDIMTEKRISIENLKERIEMQGGQLSRTSISNITNGKTSPKIDTLKVIAKALEVPIESFFSEESEVIQVIIKNKLHTFYSMAELKEFVEEGE